MSKQDVDSILRQLNSLDNYTKDTLELIRLSQRLVALLGMYSNDSIEAALAYLEFISTLESELDAKAINTIAGVMRLFLEDR